MKLRLGLGLGVVAACAVAVWLVPAGSTVAQPGAIHVQLVRGALSVSSPAASAVAGRAVTVAVTVRDARGTGKGWTLNVASPRPVKVTRVVAQCAPGSTCTLPASTGLGSSPLVLHARSASGMGVVRLTVTLAALRSGPAVPVKFSVS